MKLQKTILTTLIILFSLCLVGCKKDKTEDTLYFMAYQPATNEAKSIYTSILTEFTNETGYKVKPIFVPKDNYNTKIRNNFRSKTAYPDVFYLDQPVLADYVDQCLNLDEGFFDDNFPQDAFFQSALDTTVYNGSTYAVPLSLTSSVLLYNKSLVNTLPTSWDEWVNMNVSSGKALFGGIGSGGYASWYFQAFLKSAGGEMVINKEPVFNNAKGVEAAQMVANLYGKSSKTIRESSDAFTNGNVMFQLAHSSDIINSYNKNPTFCNSNLAATLFIPQSVGGTSYSNIGGENLAINKKPRNLEASKLLVKFLLREENVSKIIGQNFAANKNYAKVPNNDPITGEEYSVVVKECLSVVLEQLNTASARPAVKGWIEVNDKYLADALSAILDEGENIQNALNTACSQAKSVLKFD